MTSTLSTLTFTMISAGLLLRPLRRLPLRRTSASPRSWPRVSRCLSTFAGATAIAPTLTLNGLLVSSVLRNSGRRFASICSCPSRGHEGFSGDISECAHVNSSRLHAVTVVRNVCARGRARVAAGAVARPGGHLKLWLKLMSKACPFLERNDAAPRTRSAGCSVYSCVPLHYITYKNWFHSRGSFSAFKSSRVRFQFHTREPRRDASRFTAHPARNEPRAASRRDDRIRVAPRLDQAESGWASDVGIMNVAITSQQR